MCSTFDFSQKVGLEKEFSSSCTSGVRGFPLNATATIEDIITTLLTEEALQHELRFFIVPFTAGSISSA